jgi:glycosyltransferase involved in cell wall biosynthesis
MNNENIKIAVVIPVYNEQEIIQTVIADVKKKLSKFNYMILILNDGSKDATEEKLKIFNSDEKILIINKENEGHGKTLIRGYDLALKEDYDYIFQIDSDDQIPINELDKLIEFAKNYDLVCGHRHNRFDPLIRIITTIILRTVILLRHQIFIKDSNVPFRIMSKVFLKNNLEKVKNSDVPNILLSIMASKSHSFKQVKTDHKERNTGIISIRRLKLFIFCIKTLLEVLKFKI